MPLTEYPIVERMGAVNDATTEFGQLVAQAELEPQIRAVLLQSSAKVMVEVAELMMLARDLAQEAGAVLLESMRQGA